MLEFECRYFYQDIGCGDPKDDHCRFRPPSSSFLLCAGDITRCEYKNDQRIVEEAQRIKQQLIKRRGRLEADLEKIGNAFGPLTGSDQPYR